MGSRLLKISLGVYPNQEPADIIDSARQADEIGFDTLWMLDSHLLFREVYTMLGAVGWATKNLKLGTAVTNPLTRHVTVTASSFVTLSSLTQGRAKLGISVGDSALRAMNLIPSKMVELEEAVEKCRALMLGGSVEFGEGKVASLKQLSDHTVPIYVAATGPKMLGLTGRIGDGCILMNGVAPDLIQSAIDLLRQGEREAGRPEGSTKIVVWAACHPNPSAVKYNVARAILRKIPGPITDLTRTTAEKVKKAYNYDQHGSSEAEFAKLVPDELVPRFAFSGFPEQIAEQVQQLKDLGVDEVVLAIPQAENISSRNEVMQQLASVVKSFNQGSNG